MIRASWLSSLLILLTLAALLAPANPIKADNHKKDTRPNILFAIADDWGWPHASAYGDPVVKTPAFDRLAKEGALFHHAYISSPSCTPSRSAILTGQYHWRLETAGNLWSVFPDKFDTYPLILEKAGYVTGSWRKAWGPGRTQSKRAIAGNKAKNFPDFLKNRPKGKPFCFFLGASDPHRGYKKGSGKASGMDLNKIKMFKCFPDNLEVRGDVADYYWEVQRFDRDVAAAIKLLEDNGELDNTIIVVTGDHGMPFPRCKSNLYDSGARVPLAIRWPAKIKAGRTIDDFVSLTDLAPTFLEAAGIKPPADMTGRSLINVMESPKSGLVDPKRDFVLFGKERHVPGQEKPSMAGYPCRAIRTHQFLYIRNFKPERWPAGTPNYQNATITNAWLADCDNGPTKTEIVKNKDKDDHHRLLYQLSFGKRPEVELYDLSKDPEQLTNVAQDSKYDQIKKKLGDQLTAQLKATGDPRIVGGGEKFDEYKYLGGAPKFTGPKKTLKVKKISTVKPETVGMSSKKLGIVNREMKKLIADQKIAGGIVVVIRHGKIVLFNAYGKRDIEADKPMKKDTIVRIYSMTKAIATAAALTLYDQGKLDPEAPVSKYLPKLKGLKVYHEDGDKAPAREMTVADLMRHTSGVIYGWGGGPVSTAYKKVNPLGSKNLDQFIDKMSKLPLKYDPGADWTYSVSIDVLGAVIEKISGQPLDKFLAQRIFKPLDMKDTGFHVPKDKLDRFAVNYGHDKEGKLKIVDAPATSKYARPATFFSGGGGLVSTARDYMRFLIMIQNDGQLHGIRVLKKETVKLMKTDQLPAKAFPIHFGTSVRHGTGFSFGFSVRTKNSQWDPAGRLGEYGWGGAASTHYWISPADDLIVITLEQRMPYSFETELLLKSIIYGAIEDKSAAASHAPSPKIKPGQYAMTVSAEFSDGRKRESTETVEIKIESGQIKIVHPREPDNPIIGNLNGGIFTAQLNNAGNVLKFKGVLDADNVLSGTVEGTASDATTVTGSFKIHLEAK